MNVAEYLLDGKEANAPALVTQDGTYTYSDLARAAVAVAGFLTRQSGRKGDRALLLSENRFYWVAAYLGILRAGLVCVPLPVKAARQDFDYIVSTTEPRFAFLEARSAQNFAPALWDIKICCDRRVPGVPEMIAFEALQQQAPDSPVAPAEVEPNDPAIETERITALIRETVGVKFKRRGAVIGVSGGIDSSVVAALCTRALGKDRVLALLMPEADSSNDSLLLGRKLARTFRVARFTDM